MSEFKFACPVCGQHITADSSATGTQLDCPTCFRKIVVPQAPAQTDPKFVLSASEVAKPRPLPKTQPIVTPSAAPSAPPSRRVPLLVLSAAVLIAGAAGSLLFLKGKKSPPPPPAAHPTNAPVVVKKVYPPSTNQLPWMSNVEDAIIPDGPVSGRIHDRDFIVEKAVLQSGNLNLRIGTNWPPELGVSLYLFARQSEDLSGKSALVTTNNIRSPKVVLRWKDGDQVLTETFTNNFALRIEFGTQSGDRMPGKLYLCVPDKYRSAVAGTFEAEVRKPAPPKNKPKAN